jgi:arginine deiminase
MNLKEREQLARLTTDNAKKDVKIRELERELKSFKVMNAELTEAFAKDLVPANRKKLEKKSFTEDELDAMTPMEMCNLRFELDEASDKPKIQPQKPRATVGSLYGKTREQILRESK